MCEGRPYEPCPEGKNDSSVKSSQGDLMLCPSCEQFRFPELAKGKTSTVKGDPEVTVTPVYSKTTLKDSAQADKLIRCELLFFVLGTYGNHPDATIKSTILDFYREDEVLEAKALLIQSAEHIEGPNLQPFAKTRIGCNKVKSSVDDIMNIIKTMDDTALLVKLPSFCAVNRSRVPSIADELSDIAAMRLELSQLRQYVETLSAQMSAMSQIQCRVTPSSEPSSKNDYSEHSGHTGYDDGAYVVEYPPLGIASETAPVDHSVTTAEPQQSVSAGVGETSQSFATTVQENIEGFEEVNRKSRMKKNKTVKKFVIGESRAAAPFQGVAKKAVLCVSRLKIDTSAETINSFLQSKGVNVLSCYGYLDKHSRFSFMRVCVPQSDVQKICVADMWPAGVEIRPWTFKVRQ